jgi:hypothetical protein
MKLTLFWEVTPYICQRFGRSRSTLKVDAVGSSGTLVTFYQPVWHHIPEDNDLKKMVLKNKYFLNIIQLQVTKMILLPKPLSGITSVY